MVEIVNSPNGLCLGVFGSDFIAIEVVMTRDVHVLVDACRDHGASMLTVKGREVTASSNEGNSKWGSRYDHGRANVGLFRQLFGGQYMRCCFPNTCCMGIGNHRRWFQSMPSFHPNGSTASSLSGKDVSF